MTPQEFMTLYEVALSKQSWEAVAPLLHPNICVTFSNGTFIGLEAVHAVFESNFSQIKNEHYRISNLHWAHCSETEAVCLYQFQWTGIIDGEACSGSGRGTSVLVCEQDHWKLVTEHLGANAI